jgi:FkbM family methyltransferase
MPKLNNVLLSTPHGLMIINRHEANFPFGVARALAQDGVYEPQEIWLLREVINHLPPGCVLLDIGANIGVHTLEFARASAHKGGMVHAFEAQRVVYYMLAGNVAINNHENVICHHKAVGAAPGELTLPKIDYGIPTSFGSIELGEGRQREAIGQNPEWHDSNEKVPVITVDSLGLPRADLLKIDVEGMEMQVLQGAQATISQHKPFICIEFFKSDATALKTWLRTAGYRLYLLNQLNWVAVHPENPAVQISGLPPVE